MLFATIHGGPILLPIGPLEPVYCLQTQGYCVGGRPSHLIFVESRFHVLGRIGAGRRAGAAPAWDRAPLSILEAASGSYQGYAFFCSASMATYLAMRFARVSGLLAS
jgi:hypothetical protein